MLELNDFQGIVMPYGLMLSGKTTIGKLLAEKLNILFKDVDEEMQLRLKKTISLFIEERTKYHGGDKDKSWADFAIEENTTFQHLLNNNDSQIISPGGRLIMNPDNSKLILNTPKLHTIHLKISVEEQVSRALKLNDKELLHRPTLYGLKSESDFHEYFSGVQTERGPTYNNLSGTNTIDASGSVADIVDEIIFHLSKT